MSRIQAKVAAGDLGKVYILKTTSRDAQAPSVEYVKMSGGMFHDTCVHDMDMTCWILNEEPVTVHAVAHTHSQAFAEAQDVDTVVITMKYPSGAISVNDLSRHSSYGYDQRIEVCEYTQYCASYNMAKSLTIHFEDTFLTMIIRLKVPDV